MSNQPTPVATEMYAGAPHPVTGEHLLQAARMFLAFEPSLEGKVIEILGRSPNLEIEQILNRLNAEAVCWSRSSLYRVLHELRLEGVVIRTRRQFSLSNIWLRELEVWVRDATKSVKPVNSEKPITLRSIEALADELFPLIFQFVERERSPSVRIFERLPLLALCGELHFARLCRVVASYGCTVQNDTPRAEAEVLCRRLRRETAVPSSIVLIGTQAITIGTNSEVESELSKSLPLPAIARIVRNIGPRFTLRTFPIPRVALPEHAIAVDALASLHGNKPFTFKS